MLNRVENIIMMKACAAWSMMAFTNTCGVVVVDYGAKVHQSFSLKNLEKCKASVSGLAKHR